MSRRAFLGKIENATIFSGCFRALNFCVGYFVLIIIYDFRVLYLTKIYIYIKFRILLLILINICLDLLYLEVSMEKSAG
jgi:hypothetical protein